MARWVLYPPNQEPIEFGNDTQQNAWANLLQVLEGYSESVKHTLSGVSVDDARNHIEDEDVDMIFGEVQQGVTAQEAGWTLDDKTQEEDGVLYIAA